MMYFKANVNEATDPDADVPVAEINLKNEWRGDGLGAIRTNRIGLIDR